MRKIEHNRISRNIKIRRRADLAKKRDRLNKQSKQTTEKSPLDDKKDLTVTQQQTSNLKLLKTLNGQFVSQESVLGECKKNDSHKPAQSRVSRCFKNHLNAEVDCIEEISEKVILFTVLDHHCFEIIC